MSFQIRKVAVLGAGVMGSGIAGHLANAGIPSLLLDIVPPNAKEGEDTSSKKFRNKFALDALKNFRKQSPPPLVDASVKGLIEVGNFEDDIARISECDWIVEVVKEDMRIKRIVLGQVEEHAREDAIISSNTSGLSIAGMLEGRSQSFRERFLVTHFFNPVRWMKLLELVEGEDTKPEITQTIHDFGEGVLGKGIVYGKDTTNFIGNRIGVYGMMKTLSLMQEKGLSIEEVDKIFGKAMGRPNSAIFRTADVVGLDTFIHVSENCYDTLEHDEERDTFAIPDYLREMVKAGMLGAKTRQGFYKRVKKDDGRKVNMVLDLDKLEYRDPEKVSYDSLKKARGIDDVSERVAAVTSADDAAGQFAELATLHTLAYSARRIPEISDDVVNIDRGLRWGFGWDLGPFETWDAIGVKHGVERMQELGIDVAPWVTEMIDSGRDSFYVVDGADLTYWDIPTKSAKVVPESDRVLKVSYIKREADTRKIDGNDSATVWDMGEGVALLEFHTKMNAIDGGVVEMMNRACDIVEERGLKGLVIGNDADPYSAGANLGAVLMAAKGGQWGAIEELVSGFQAVNQRLYYSNFPVVTAPAGKAFGGGCEVAMAGNHIQAASDTFIGLVEFGVGLIPGGGGNLQLLRHLYGAYSEDRDIAPDPFIQKAFMAIGMAKVAMSAEEAKKVGFLRDTDGISMNRDFVLSDARAMVVGLHDAGFRPPRKKGLMLSGPSGAATIGMLLYDMEINGQISAHDRVIGNKLATVLTGGATSTSVPVTEERLLELEREAFMSLVGEEKSQQRMEHMLLKGKPLRN